MEESSMSSNCEITCVLLVSRPEYLQSVVATIEGQTRRPDRFVAVVAGPHLDDTSLELKDFEVFYTGRLPSTNMEKRRENIAHAHNLARSIVADDNSDYIFLVEDDGLLPDDALEKLESTIIEKGANMVTGVEVGRHGVPYVGIWKKISDNKIETTVNRASKGGIEAIDASGLYCCLVKKELYMKHRFNSDNGLGPDVNFGLSMDNVYVDWSVHVGHISNKPKQYTIIPATTKCFKVVIAKMSDSLWRSRIDTSFIE